MCCHSSGPEQSADTNTVWPHLLSLGILAPGGGVRLRWELGRGGGTCGVETKRMLSLHTICSGMHLIKRKRGCVCALCNCSPRPYNHFSQHHKLQGISLFWGHTHEFPRPLILCRFSCKCGHTLASESRLGMGGKVLTLQFKSISVAGAGVGVGKSSLHE